jgi:hypothetical protein
LFREEFHLFLSPIPRHQVCYGERYGSMQMWLRVEWMKKGGGTICGRNLHLHLEIEIDVDVFGGSAKFTIRFIISALHKSRTSIRVRNSFSF